MTAGSLLWPFFGPMVTRAASRLLARGEPL